MFRAALLTFLMTTSAVLADELPIKVPSDPGAEYTLLNVHVQKGAIVQIESRRNGKSGISHAVRRVDCKKHVSSYIYDEDARSPKFPVSNSDMHLRPITEDSITWWISKYGCEQAKVGSPW